MDLAPAGHLRRLQARCCRPTRLREHQVAYLHKDRYTSGDVDARVTTSTEEVSYPYLSVIDDREGIAEGIAVWTSRHKSRCDASQPVRIEAHIHGRSELGIMKGPRDVD